MSIARARELLEEARFLELQTAPTKLGRAGNHEYDFDAARARELKVHGLRCEAAVEAIEELVERLPAR